jgi:uncharacterized protein YecE (DUF72 family)
MGSLPIPVWIGTAGYAWPEWVGAFYPEGTTLKHMPRFYATQFPCVEINSTFYRAPTRDQLAHLADRTAAGFQFSLKVPRTVSHEHRIHALRPFREAANELASRHRLIGFVLQFPEQFTDTARRRDWVTKVADGLYGYPTWVEFRHRSWFRPRLGDWLRERGLELASIDVPALPQLFPRGAIDPGTKRVYVRLHSREPDNWFSGGKARYDYEFTDDELREWIGKLTEAAPRLTDVYLMFNNCRGIQGPTNARRMAELIAAEAPALRVVEPPAPPPPRQGNLFEDE